MYSIGTIAKMVNISADTLRYYDEIGLFVPHKVSEETKYRFYTEEQAIVLARIIELKQYGFSLNEIKNIIQKGDEINVFLNRYWALENEKNKIQNAIDGLTEIIKQKLGGSKMNKKIMTADDSAFMRMMLKEILTKDGYDIIGEAANGQEAFDMYKDLKPELVVLNIEMPKLHGIDALKLIKEFDNNANIIMLSALCHSTTIVNAILAGAKYFIAKPFQQERLVQAIKTMSFQADIPNKQIAEMILSTTDYSNMSQNHIDLLISTLYSNKTESEVKSILEKMVIGNDKTYSYSSSSKNYEAQPPLPLQQYEITALLNQLLDEQQPVNEEMQTVNKRLDKLEIGQEEILGILKEMTSRG